MLENGLVSPAEEGTPQGGALETIAQTGKPEKHIDVSRIRQALQVCTAFAVPDDRNFKFVEPRPAAVAKGLEFRA